MKEQIVDYLLQHSTCPLPRVGSLNIISQPAMVVQGEKLINAPKQIVEFKSTELPSAHFIRFIAANFHQSEEIAFEHLTDFCDSLASLKEGEEVLMPTLGSFRVDAQGKLLFAGQELDELFYPAVNAERVIHENDTHQILVGDTETTNRVMSDFFNETSPRRIDRWWVWAIILFLIAAVVIFLYASNSNSHSIFGNSIKVQPVKAPSTYKTGN